MLNLGNSHGRAILATVTLAKPQQGLGMDTPSVCCFSDFQVTPTINNTGLFTPWRGCKPESQRFWLDRQPAYCPHHCASAGPVTLHSTPSSQSLWMGKMALGESEGVSNPQPAGGGEVEWLKPGVAQSWLCRCTKKTRVSTPT